MKPAATLVLAAILVVPGLSAAQGSADAYGTLATDITTVSSVSFLPMTSFGDTEWFTEANGERYVTHTLGSSRLLAPLDDVPNGARILEVAFYGRDDNGGEGVDITGNLLAHWRQGVDGTTVGTTPIGSCSTSGAPGPTVCSFALDHTVRRRADWNADAEKDVASYVLEAVLGGGSTLKLAMVAVLWQRQLHPAPATSTFSDVPTDHPFFQHVEALAASGITAGCGGGAYCVDDPLTRGQAAVFLATALGLHWDWDNQ